MRMTPNLISAYRLSGGDYKDNTASLPDGTYQIARPITAPTLEQRIVWAWCVFIGKYDALIWPGQGDK